MAAAAAAASSAAASDEDSHPSSASTLDVMRRVFNLNFVKYLDWLKNSISAVSVEKAEDSPVSPRPSVATSVTSNTTDLKNAKKEFEKSKKIKHEFEEQLALKMAFDYLTGSKDGSINPSKEATVLVDIIERKGRDEKVIAENAKELECHTVVLYREVMEDGKFCVSIIDPSNFTFSLHLGNQGDIDFSDTNISRIQILHGKNLNIYVPGSDDIGTRCDEFRDCIDLSAAIGLAFGYEENYNIFARIFLESTDSASGKVAPAASGAGGHPSLDAIEKPALSLFATTPVEAHGKLMKSPPILCIQHGSDIIKDWHDTKSFPVRLKQSKDFTSSKILYSYLEILKNRLAEIKKIISDESYLHFQLELNPILATASIPSNIKEIRQLAKKAGHDASELVRLVSVEIKEKHDHEISLIGTDE